MRTKKEKGQFNTVFSLFFTHRLLCSHHITNAQMMCMQTLLAAPFPLFFTQGEWLLVMEHPEIPLHNKGCFTGNCCNILDFITTESLKHSTTIPGHPMTILNNNKAIQACEQNDSYRTTNRDLLLPYLVPYFVYVGLASFFQNEQSAIWIYSFRLIVEPVLLFQFWRHYVPLTGPKNRWASIAYGIAAGTAGCILWVLLVTPFADPRGGPGWGDMAFTLRLLSASVLVPVFEELLMRGFIFRFTLQWEAAHNKKADDPFGQTLDASNIADVKPGQWSYGALIISTLLFTLGHRMYEWPAALLYGLLMSCLWIFRKDLISCIIAHGTTNFMLAIYVRATGQWGIW